jgi:N-acetylmuramoyl-L-alanine amidase
MSISRRDLLRGTAGVAAAGSLPLVLGAGNAVAASHPTLRTGSRGAAVLALQRRLTSLGYWLGAADGQFGDLTRQAVVAVQKVAGLARDGVCGPATWARVDAGVRPAARTTKGGVVEIDKKTQTLLVVNAGVVRWVFNTSTGSGRKYRQGGKDHIAVTPAGDFRVFRRVDGWDDGPLGKLYRPQYFNGGIAVHGYPVVPSTPESHGCCRVSLPGMDFLWGAGGMGVGTRVLVR